MDQLEVIVQKALAERIIELNERIEKAVEILKYPNCEWEAVVFQALEILTK